MTAIARAPMPTPSATLPTVASLLMSVTSLLYDAHACARFPRFAGVGGSHDTPPAVVMFCWSDVALACADCFECSITPATTPPATATMPPMITGARLEGAAKRPGWPWLFSGSGAGAGLATACSSGFGCSSSSLGGGGGGGGAGSGVLAAGGGAVIALAKRAIAFSPASTVTLVVSIVPSGPLNLTVCAPGST